ncbi:MAG: hypothetical protein HYY96_15385 [Candidatus Tectomicrobia bacterium]|nr:hypothetical protein [Candidatus Tectomicrobia bacterium]
MGEIVLTIALAHAPGLTGWLDQAPQDQQQRLRDGYQEMGRIVRAAKPDTIIGLANDHILNFQFDNPPNFCIGTADIWHGPAPWFKDWLNVPDYTVKGNRDLAHTLVREGDRAGVRFAYSDSLLFDDNWSVPLFYLTPDHDVPLVPIHMNCILPPLPTPAECFRVGEVIAEIVRTRRPARERIILMATGGLSHDPGGPAYFNVDEAFDRWFLSLLEEGNPQRVLKEATIERMKQAGDGGTSELLAWIAAMGAVGGRRARTICYEPAVELRCGMGGVVWEMA